MSKKTTPETTEDIKPSEEILSTDDLKIDLKQHRQRLGLQIGVTITIGVVVIAGVVAWLRYRPEVNIGGTQSSDSQPQPTVTTAPADEPKVASSLDGTLVATSLSSRRPLAVMIENHPDARPQFGLGTASVVYETVTEGGITRFMALFGPESGPKIGPVRSARPYFIDWLLEYDGAYAHVGGSKEALAAIKEFRVKDLDQFAIGDDAYRREPQKGKALEHTMFTDIDKLMNLASKKFGSEQNWTKPLFSEPLKKDNRPTSQTVTVDFSTATYAVTWSYDPETNRYLRSQAGSFHKDAASGDTLAADTVIVQEVIRTGEQSMETVGSGKAQVFENGKRIEGTWKKEKRSSPTKFFDPDTKEILRLPGVTWFEIVPPGSKVTVTNQ